MRTIKNHLTAIALMALLPLCELKADVVTVDNPNGSGIYQALVDLGLNYRTVDSLKVTGTVSEADFKFLGNSMNALKWIDLSETDITAISEEAFYRCQTLREIILPSTVETFMSRCFEECYNLESVSGYENVRTIGYRAFANTKITKVPFGDEIISIGDQAFYYCEKITGDIVFPDCFKTLDNYAFHRTSISSVDFSNCSVNKIPWYCFGDCYNLGKVTFSENTAFSIDGYAFWQDTLLKYIFIPETVTSIGNRSFGFDWSMTNRTVTIQSKTPISAENNSFADSYKEYLTLIVPAGTTFDYITSRGYSVFDAVKEMGYSVSIDGKGTVSVGEKTCDNGSIYFADNINDTKFNIMPATGYDIMSISFNDNPVTLTDGSYTVDASVMTGSLKVKFAAKSLNLTVAKGSGGTITYNGAIVENGAVMAVNGGESLGFSIVPDDGCFIKTITFNGTEYMTINGAMNYNTPVLADNSTLAIVFGTEQDVADYLMVKISQKGYGTILYKDSPIKQGSTVLVKRGEKPEFTFIPGTDGYVRSLLVNSLDLSSSLNANKLSFGSLNQDIDMQVEFFSAVDVQIDNPNGKLKSLLTEQDITLRRIKKIKLTGNVTENDLAIISSMQLLQTVDLSETTVTEIPSEMFRSKTSLENVAFPLSLTSIGYQAFLECKNLKIVSGCDNVRRIENGAFRYCESLEVLPFGNKIEELNGPFSYCKSLPEKIVMPSSLKWIINSSFNESSVSYLDLSQCSSEGYFQWYAFTGLKTVLLPENGKYRLDDSPFRDSKITSLIIPESITECRRSIFNGANNLRDVYMRSSVPPTTDSDPFGGNYTTMTLYVPAGSAEDYGNTPYWCDFGKIVEYGIGLQSDSRGAVYVNGKLQSNESAIFPDGKNDLILSMVPNSGYELDQVIFDGTPLVAQVDGTYTIGADVNVGSLAVKWKAKKYGITVNYSGNGSVICGGQTIASGAVVTVDTASVVQFEMAPVSGYLVKNISFNGTESVVQNGGKVYVTPAISGTSTLDVTFAESSATGGVFELSISTGNNGSIIYKHTTLLQETSINIASGDKAVLEINPKNNYKITQVTYNGTDVTHDVVNSQYVINSVTESASITVSFGVKTDVVVPLTVAGTLGTAMFDELKENVEKLAVTGPMNSSDFTVIREEMPHLKTLDLSGANFSYVPNYAFNSDSTKRSFTSIILPPTVNHLNSYAFGGCSIDTFVVTSKDVFSGSWDAFDDYAKKNTVLLVPIGMEDAYRQYNPWYSFKHLTDGVINNNGDEFVVDGNQYVVTDLVNNKIKAIINSVSQFAGLPDIVSIDSYVFTVDGAKFVNTDSEGNRYILTDRDFGSWKGKYLYSSDYKDNTWIGAPDENWTMPDFDDSEWTSFDGPISTNGEYTQWKGQNDCYWVRRTFQLDEIDFKSLRLFYDVNENMVVYVNGIKVNESSWCNKDIPASYFKVGNNVIVARMEHGNGSTRIDFSLYQNNFMIDGLIYRVTNSTRKEMTLVGARAEINEINIPLNVSFLGTDYSVTTIVESAFRSDDGKHYYNKVNIPATVTDIGCNAFYNCLIDTLVLNNKKAFNSCWYAFDDNTKKKTVVCVPVGTEGDYRQYDPWNEFAYITDGVVNRNNDVFVVDDIQYLVTDYDNLKVKALPNTKSQCEIVPTMVQADGHSFTVESIKLTTLNDNGYYIVLSNIESGVWQGKYLHSAEKTGDNWVGAPAEDWMNSDYDDSSWIPFAGPIATDGHYSGNTQTNWPYGSERDCYWIRRTFELEDLDISDIRLRVSTAGNTEVYINGNKVYDESGNSSDISVPLAYLKQGTNVIAAKGEKTRDYNYLDLYIEARGFVFDGVNYAITNNTNKECQVSSMATRATEITIPATISIYGNTYKVASIADNAFANDSILRSVKGMENVKRINYRAFYNCVSLKEVSIPDGLNYISSYAFDGCKSLDQTIVLPASIENVDYHAFANSGIKEVVISCKYVGNDIFYNCKSLEKVTFAEGVEVISGAAFNGCSGIIGKLVLPSTLKEIGYSAFRSCSGITEVVIPAGVKRISNWAFSDCQSLTSVTFNEGLQVIEEYAFNCCNIINLELPSSLKELSFYAFQSNRGLKSVSFGNGITTIGSGAFNNCGNLIELVMPESLTTIDNDAFRSCTNLQKIKLNEGLTTIGEYAFYNTAIDSLVIPSTVTSLKNDAFRDCKNLVFVSIPASLNSISKGLFFGAEKLNKIVIPESVTSIGSSVFYGCRSLGELTIPVSVIQIGVNALRGIPIVHMASATPPILSTEEQFDDMTAIVLPNGAYDTYANAEYWSKYKSQFTTESNLNVTVTVAQDSVNSNLSQVLGEENLSKIVGLKVIGTINSYDIMIIRNKMSLLRYLDLSEATIVANNYEYYEGSHTEDNIIGANSFRGINISSILLPTNVTDIRDNAFNDCNYLKSIVIPDAVTGIGGSAFYHCDVLQDVIIGDGVKTIEWDAFEYCRNLRYLKLGKNTEAIGAWAFNECYNLKTIDFGRKLKYISEYAFDNCRNLTDIILPVSLIEIGYRAFSNCQNLKEVKIPSSVKYIREYAFDNCPLEKVYTYTIEPTKIAQNTFSAYKTAKLYIPGTSKYNYWWHTQWSQFLELVEFNEPYEFFYLNGDYSLGETNGRIDGNPDMEMNSGSGIIVEGNDVQNLSNIELNYEFRTGWDDENQTSFENKGASIIAGDGNTSSDVANLTAESMDVNIGVDGKRWYFFCFPFDLSLDSIECTADYVFYTYDGAKRAKGQSGWVKLDSEVTTLSEDNGYIFQASRTGILTIHVNSEYLSFKSEDKQKILHTYEASSASNASWNFLGNPFISYYDIVDLASEYDAPIAVWNGNSYDVYKPGDDDNYQLKPFEAFFVQKDKSKSAVEFLPENRITFNAATERNIERANLRAKVGNTIDLNRRIVNIEIAGGTDGKTDKTRLVFNNEAKMDYEIGRDASKFHTDGVPQIYTVNGSVKYAINERPTGMDDIHLGFYAPVEGEYTLSVPRSDAEVEIYDNLTKKTVDFTFGDYTFNSEAGTFNERFVVRLTGGGITAVKDGFRVDGITVVTVDGGIELSGNVSGRVTVYNEAGMLLSKPDFAGKLTLDDGIYLIKIGDNSVKLSVK